MTDIDDPHEYVTEHRETLVRIIKHGDDQFVRALCLAALVEFGDDPDPDQLRAEIDRLEREGLA
jgi:diadenosine tetraphosphatase ApaH/serine/threonine PP2A family protein phosphatase